MKTTHLVIATAIGLSLSLPTYASENSWYVGASLSNSDLGDIDTQSTSPVAGVSRNLDLESDDDTGFGIKIGKTILSNTSGNLDIELNYSESEHDIESVQFQNTLFTNGAAAGEVDVKSLSLRAKYKFNIGFPIKPYIGVGIGIVDLDVDAVYGASANSVPGSLSQPPFITGSDEALALEVLLGTEWNINKRWSIFSEYSYTDVSDVNLARLGGGPGGLAITNQEGDFDIQAFTVGINYRF